MSEDNQNQDENAEVAAEEASSDTPQEEAVSAADDTIADSADAEEATTADDTLAADNSAEEAEVEELEVAATAEPPTPPPAPPASNVDEMTPLWRVEKDHGSVTRLLTRDADDVDLTVEKARGGRAIFNLLLVLLIIGVTGVSVKLYQYHSAESTLDRKRQVNEALEEDNTRTQQKEMPKFGNMRIESTEQYSDLEIIIMKRGSKAWQSYMDRYVKDGIATAAANAVKLAEQEGSLAQQPSAEATVIKLEERTPMSLMGTDISSLHVVTAKMDGFEPESFVVGGEHIWEKDPGSGQFKFYKQVKLFASDCASWWLYDVSLAEEKHWTTNGECVAHYTEARKQDPPVDVTECQCKLAPKNPEGAEGEIPNPDAMPATP